MIHPSQEKEWKKAVKNPKSGKDTAVSSDKEGAYAIDLLNLGEPTITSESESKCLLVHCSEGQM